MTSTRAVDPAVAQLGRSASMPSTPGINRSSRITSGVKLDRRGDTLVAVGRLADHVDVVLQLEERTQTAAYDRVVVGDEDADRVHRLLRHLQPVTVVP